MRIDLTTPEGRQAANEAAARLCGFRQAALIPSHTGEMVWVHRERRGATVHAPDFLAGLRPDGTCDESKVNGELLWMVWCAIKAVSNEVALWWGAPEGAGDWCWNCSEYIDQCIGATASHAHPVAALLLVADALKLLDIARAEGKGAKTP